MKLMIIVTMLLWMCPLYSVPFIHVFGDSHAKYNFKTKRPDRFLFNYVLHGRKFLIPFCIHHLPAKTMHSVGKNGLMALNIRLTHVQEGDIVVFVFGEIDARAHIGKQRDLHKRNLDEIIEVLAVNYLDMIKKNKQQYNNIHCVITSIIPPTDGHCNPQLPFYGLLQDRITITKKLNKRLEELCTLHDFEFLDIYELYATPEGSLNPQLSDGLVHVHPNKNKPIKIKLINLLLAKGILIL